MKTEPPVTLKQTNNVIRKKFLISSIVVILLLVLFQKQEVKATTLEEDVNTLEVAQVQVNETIEQDLPIEYTEEELILLATVIYAEAGICDDEEKYRVGNVVINRLNDIEHNEFKNVNSIKEVIYQKRQFTSVGGEAWKHGPTENEMRIAKELLEGNRILPDYVVWFSKAHNFGVKYYESKWHIFSGWE